MDIDWNVVREWLWDTGLNVAGTVALAVVAYFVLLLVLKFLLHNLTRAHARARKISATELKKRQDTLDALFKMVLKIVITVVALFSILEENFGLSLAPLLASAGIIGVALGFGAQNIIKDALAGFFVILENQYRVGDYVEIDGSGMDRANGSVEKISLRSTAIRDRDGNLHFIPNGGITQIINRTIGFSKVHFKFRVATTEKIDVVKRIVNETGAHMAVEKKWKDKIKEAIHFDELGGFDKDGYEISVSGVTEPAVQWSVTSEYRTRLLNNLEKAKIEIA
jgi:small conductance mechanosensitive channel